MTKSFAEALTEAIQKSGKSQRQIAAELGISPAYLNDMKMGNRKAPKTDVRKRICDHLGFEWYAPEAADLKAENDRLKAWLQGIINLDPKEVAYDQFAYERLVGTYRRAAQQALDECATPGN